MVVFGTKNNEISAESTPKIETAEVEEVVSEPETPKEDETAEKIAVNFSSDKKDDLSEKTIEVPQISAEPKRPLGSPQSGKVSNFDIKPADRSREIRRAKFENSPSSAPMLSRDEYSAPVVAKKKKSGFWTVALIMLIMAVFGVGGGFAIWYFFGQY
jgi:flagellar basal body-associated protein FliL